MTKHEPLPETRSGIQRGFEERHGGGETTTNRLLGLLFAYARGSRHITEIGVSNPHTTYALLHALETDGGPSSRLVSMDIERAYPRAIEEVETYAKESGIEFRFVQGDSAQVDIEETDFLFIDSNHTREHLLAELNRHSGKVRKMISFHDTEGPCCLLPVVQEWLGTSLGQAWRMRAHYRLSHGLTLIERRPEYGEK